MEYPPTMAFQVSTELAICHTEVRKDCQFRGTVWTDRQQYKGHLLLYLLGKPHED